MSWVDVGHRSGVGDLTNDVSTYPSSLPIDDYMLKHIWQPSGRRISYGTSGSYTWSISEEESTSKSSSRSFETNTTVSAGVTAGNVTVDAGVTVGFGWESSRSLSWTDTLEIGGAIEKFSDSSLQAYFVVPYVYQAKATSLAAGVTYPYLEADFYVPCIEPCGAAFGADGGAFPAGARPGVR
jgi:hypothetical protein